MNHSFNQHAASKRVDQPNRRIVGTRLPSMIAVALSFVGSAAHADGPQIVERVANPPPGHVVWRITRPTVNSPRTEYPQIVFAPGSTVTVTGKGCVQSGGKGATWKRYVDPAGADSAQLYHGEIWIPGANPQLQFFLPTQPTVYSIPANSGVAPDAMHLVLGYTDRNQGAYKDNGYSARNSDNGNLYQCWGLGDAVVEIDIEKTPPVVAPPAVASYTFSIDNVTIRNLRSRDSDTDTVAAGVVVDGTPSAMAKEALGDLHRGSHDLSFPVQVDSVTPTDRIAIEYTVLNAGHANAQKIDDAVSQIVAKGASAIPVVGSIIGMIGSVGFSAADANCDGPVVAGSFMATGAELAAWTQAGPMQRSLSFVGSDSAVGCGTNSFYDVTYTVRRNDPDAVMPFSLRIDARTRQSSVGKSASFVHR